MPAAQNSTPPPPLTRTAFPEGKIGIIGGSGLNLEDMLDSVEKSVPFQDIPGLLPSSVQGHASCFLFGQCGGAEVVVQSGRLHTYEGLGYAQVIRPVEALHSFGVRTLVCTNAVGALLPELVPGALVAATRLHTWPYPRFALPKTLDPDFIVPGCDATGSYWWMHGPCYETRAEIAALHRLGATTVGMSVAPELAACQKLGIKTAAISCVTNNCLTEEHTTHDRVLHVARTNGKRMAGLLRGIFGA